MPGPLASKNPSGFMDKNTRNLWIWLALSVLALAVSQALIAWAGARLGGQSGPWIAAYLAIRAAVYVGAAYGFIRHAGRRRFQALALVGLLGFLDQVVFKGVLMRATMQANPQEWAGVDPTAVYFGLAVSYVYFFPIVLVMGFIGTFLARDLAA